MLNDANRFGLLIELLEANGNFSSQVTQGETDYQFMKRLAVEFQRLREERPIGCKEPDDAGTE